MLVSVIIPCFNVEQYLPDCLDSVLNQTYNEIEVFIVDNNSSDNTLELAQNYQRKFSNLTALSIKKQGASIARNFGLQYCKGKWIQFLDADDYISADKIEHQVGIVKPSDNPVMVIGSGYNKYIGGELKEFTQDPQQFFKSLIYSNVGYTGSNFFKREALKSVNGWNESLTSNQDLDLIFRIAITYGLDSICYDAMPKTYHRLRTEGQISDSKSIQHRMDCINFREQVLDFLKLNEDKYYRKNQQFYDDAMYYYVYALGLLNPELGRKEYRKRFTPDYQPRKRADNKISLVNEWGVRILGFKNYCYFRQLFLKLYQ